MQEFWTEMLQWWADLPRPFVFLLTIPFLVAGSAFLAEWFKKWRPGKPVAREGAPRGRHAGHHRVAHAHGK